MDSIQECTVRMPAMNMTMIDCATPDRALSIQRIEDKYGTVKKRYTDFLEALEVPSYSSRAF